MDISVKLLALFFQQNSAERVLNTLSEYAEHLFYNIKDEMKACYKTYAETLLNGYSEDEQTMLYKIFQNDSVFCSADEKYAAYGTYLEPLVRFGRENLTMTFGQPRFRQERALIWRDAYLRLGQDMIVCAYLADYDHRKNIVREDFTWPAIIRSDNTELEQMLKGGMAENHCHLGGSSQSFQVTWCAMMNYPEMIRTELKNFDGDDLLSEISRGPGDNALSLHERLELAALLRSILFRALYRDEFTFCDDKPFDSRRAFADEYLLSFYFQKDLGINAEKLRWHNGAIINYPDYGVFCPDYALNEHLLQMSLDSDVRILIGERFFLYQCTRACMDDGDFSHFEKELFYLYLLIKCKFRSEMIQVNQQVGFKNFSNYQDRKSDAWDNNPYAYEAVRLSLNYRLSTERITSLESRVGPKPSKEKTIDAIYKYDKSKNYADCSRAESWNPENYEFDINGRIDEFKERPYFFVYHFIKKKDERSFDGPVIPCRHQKRRKEIRQEAIALSQALYDSAYFRCRVRGIDAASNEVYCRPEVFACVFRYLNARQQMWNTRLESFSTEIPICLSMTYHVGEDFLDLADGLRAIDEAVNFMHLKEGCRIGHALALGVDPTVHYATKSFQIVTTKQDRLDDLVWLIFRSQELGVRINQKLRSKLKNEAYTLFRELYGTEIDDNKWSIGLLEYYKSMQLRCDDPSVYIDFGQVNDIDTLPSEFEAYLTDKENEKLSAYRADKAIVGLYYFYHYGIESGKIGATVITRNIEQEYINFVCEMQDALQTEIAEKGIIIECNPSSNVLIGTFRDYRFHPIFRFNNQKLGSQAIPSRTQLRVCVNTDDLGVFDTSLDSEYALLLQTLREQKDEKGERIYNDREIMCYLDDIRIMGERAVFPGVHEKDPLRKKLS